jgi:prepilin-type N-terminal cleavage/methylation domain-containing protein
MMSERSQSAENGFTLVELLAVLAIASLVIGLGYNVLLSVIQYNDTTQSNIRLRQEANSIVSVLKAQHLEEVNEYRVCYDELLSEGNIVMDLGLNTNMLNQDNECVEDINPTADLSVVLTIFDRENNSFTVETTIKGRATQSIVLERKDENQDFYDYLRDNNVFIYGSQFVFEGNQVNGPNASIIIQGDLDTSQVNGGALNNTSNLYVNGDVFFDRGSAGFGSQSTPGQIVVNGDLTLWSGRRKIYGDVYVNGNFRLKDAEIHGNVYVNGSVELGWTPTLVGDSAIYYTGNLVHPSSYSQQILSKVIKQQNVAMESVPDFELPALREDNWYTEHGFTKTIKGNENVKLFGANIQIDSHYNANVGKYIDSFTNFTIVSKGDITIGGNSWIKKFSGILIAPNGRVTFNGASFEGMVISRDGFYVVSGGTIIEFRQIGEYIKNEVDFPLQP